MSYDKFFDGWYLCWYSMQQIFLIIANLVVKTIKIWFCDRCNWSTHQIWLAECVSIFFSSLVIPFLKFLKMRLGQLHLLFWSGPLKVLSLCNINRFLLLKKQQKKISSSIFLFFNIYGNRINLDSCLIMEPLTLKIKSVGIPWTSISYNFALTSNSFFGDCSLRIDLAVSWIKVSQSGSTIGWFDVKGYLRK